MGYRKPGSDTHPDTNAEDGTEAQRLEAGPSISHTLLECQECSALALGVHDGEHEFSCHGEPMVPVEDEGIDHEDPDFEGLLTEVYDMPKMIIDICHFIFDEGTATVEETSDRFGYDRDNVAEYLRELADRGFLKRRSADIGDGGVVHLYEARDMEDSRREEMVGFLRWAGKGAAVIAEANEIKDWCLSHDEKGLERSFWDVYDERSTL